MCHWSKQRCTFFILLHKLLTFDPAYEEAAWPDYGLLRACLNLMEKYINKDGDATNSNTVKNVSVYC